MSDFDPERTQELAINLPPAVREAIEAVKTTEAFQTPEVQALAALLTVTAVDLDQTAAELTRVTEERDGLHDRVEALQNDNEALGADRDKYKQQAIELFRRNADLKDRIDHLKPLAEVAYFDDLTGILNRRGLTAAYDELTGASVHRRNNHSDRILFLDLDNFKEVNTLLGHQGGDTVLEEVAETLQDELREFDIVGRYGGDEFVVILPDTAGESAEEIAERLHVAIREMEAVPMQITVSIGIDTIDRTLSLDKAVIRANEAMHSAKNQGRDQTITVRR